MMTQKDECKKTPNLAVHTKEGQWKEDKTNIYSLLPEPRESQSWISAPNVLYSGTLDDICPDGRYQGHICFSHENIHYKEREQSFKADPTCKLCKQELAQQSI